MADINATDLTQETLSSLDGAEQFIMFDTAEGKRATVQAVGEYVLSKLTSSLMGSSQTVANAFTALKTRTPVMSGAYATALASDTDLNTITDLGSYGASSSAIAATLVNSPVSVAFIMYVEDVTQTSSETSNYRYRRQRIVALTPTEREEYTRGFNTSNGGTSWTFQEWQKKVTRAEFDNLRVGGRNLIINTLYPVDTPASDRPKIFGATGETTSGRGTCTVAEHGLRFTLTEAGNWEYFRFGSSSGSSANAHLMGLTAGETYTYSFDVEYKLLSGTSDTTTPLQLEVQHYGTSGTSFTKRNYKVIHSFGTSDLTDRGVAHTDHVEFTFTIPATDTKLYLDVKMNNTDVKTDYLVGDYIELRNIKLEKGNRASDWSPAPEDLTTPLMSPSATATTVDANAISSTRWLRVASDSLSIPVAKQGMLYTLYTSSTVATQFFVTSDNVVYYRQKWTDWQSWIQVGNKEDLTADDFTSQVTVAEGEEFTSNTSFVRIGKTCHIIYQGVSKAHEANAVICTLPQGYRPTKQVFAPFSKNANAYGTLAIFTNGNITLTAISSTTAVGRVYFNATYFIE